MALPKSLQGGARRRQAAKPSNEDFSSGLEDEEAISHQNSRRNCSPRNTSDLKYLNVSSRYDFGHWSGLNSSAEIDKRSSRFNTSTSSEADSPDKGVARCASKYPSLYPDLGEIKESSKYSRHTAVVREASRYPKPIPGFVDIKESSKYSPDKGVARCASKFPRLYPDLGEIKESSKYSRHKAVVREASRYPKLNRDLEETEESSKLAEVSLNKICILSAVVIFFILALVMWMVMSPQFNKSTEIVYTPVPPFDRFTGNIGNLQQALPNQNMRLWRTVKASAKHVLNDTESEYPVVILMASPTKHAHIAKCIARKIANNFELSLDLAPVESVVDIGQMQYLNPASHKQKLDEDLNSAFSSNQRKAFVIDNLQLLHPEAALMLYGYCDNNNAPFKDVMMVLLLYVDQHEVSDYSNASVDDFLERLWSRGLGADEVKDLVSQLANNIVTVEMEDEETFSKVCL